MTWAAVILLQNMLLLSAPAETAAAAADPVPAVKGLQPQLLTVPPGFDISVYSDGLPKARTMSATVVNGSTIVYVGGKEPIIAKPGGKVYYVVDEDSDGVPDFNGTLLESDTPNGVVVQGSDLLLSGFEDGKGMVWRLRNVHSYALRNQPFTGTKTVITDQLPGDRWHGRRVLRFAPNGLLVLAVGVPCNVCKLDRTPEGIQFGTLYSLNVTSGELRQLATGLRNSVGFDWHPQSRELYFTDNGGDKMGDDRPDCEFNRIPKNSPTVRAGPNATTPASIPNYGHPYCHTEGQGDPYVRDLGGGLPLPDPQFNANSSEVNCSDPKVNMQPVQALGPHTAPLGMRFYRWRDTPGAFPREYDGSAFVAEHGSWNRAVKIGYRVMMLRVNSNTGAVTEYKPFASGWLQNEGMAAHNFTWGRPVDVEQLPDGSLLISDDEVGALYRVTYNASNVNSSTGGANRKQRPGSGQSSGAAVAVVPALRASFVAAAVALITVWIN